MSPSHGDPDGECTKCRDSEAETPHDGPPLQRSYRSRKETFRPKIRTRPCQLSPRRRVYQVTEEIHAESRTSGRRDSVCACRLFDLRREPGGADGCGGSRGSKATRRREGTGRPPG